MESCKLCELYKHAIFHFNVKYFKNIQMNISYLVYKKVSAHHVTFIKQLLYLLPEK